MSPCKPGEHCALATLVSLQRKQNLLILLRALKVEFVMGKESKMLNLSTHTLRKRMGCCLCAVNLFPSSRNSSQSTNTKVQEIHTPFQPATAACYLPLFQQLSKAPSTHPKLTRTISSKTENVLY